MYIQNSHISKLIFLHTKGELDDVQKKELQNWLKEERNQKVFEEIVNKSIILKKVREYDDAERDIVWSKLDNQLFKKKDKYKWLKYATVILLPFAIGLFILTQTPKVGVEMVQVEEVKPGGTNAKLYFSNGEVIDLQKDTSSVLRSKDNLLVQRENNQLKVNSNQLIASYGVNMNRIVTPIGGEYQLVLSDGTKVWLNADSYLEFPSKFSDKYRKVKAKGEVYFDVATNKEWPFVVESQGVELKVLGTEFNLRSYFDEDFVATTLIEGSVLVSNSLKESLKLSPGKQIIVERGNNKMFERIADIESVTGWRKGRFIFKRRRVEDIMYDLARWYDVKIFFSNSRIKDVSMTLDITRYSEIEDVLDVMEATRLVSFNLSGKTIMVN
ncbi:MAG: FecR domain-containing protein [Carboxylicivirga sp.]|jgi:ferric-dicitrate binding protein FerR (iron transport regulator)|nr:FecR domain-containing protein [Carboxylicivirga sp.]